MCGPRGRLASIEHLGSVHDGRELESLFVRPQAKIDACMRGQILRVFRPRPLGEIGGRVDDRRAHVRSDAHRDHIFGNLLSVLRPR